MAQNLTAFVQNAGTAQQCIVAQVTGAGALVALGGGQLRFELFPGGPGQTCTGVPISTANVGVLASQTVVQSPCFAVSTTSGAQTFTYRISYVYVPAGSPPGAPSVVLPLNTCGQTSVTVNNGVNPGPIPNPCCNPCSNPCNPCRKQRRCRCVNASYNDNNNQCCGQQQLIKCKPRCNPCDNYGYGMACNNNNTVQDQFVPYVPGNAVSSQFALQIQFGGPCIPTCCPQKKKKKVKRCC